MKKITWKMYAAAILRSVFSLKPAGAVAIFATIVSGVLPTDAKARHWYLWACVMLLAAFTIVDILLNVIRLYRKHRLIAAGVAAAAATIDENKKNVRSLKSVNAICVLILILLTGGYFMYDYYTPTIRYYEDYVERDNKISGLRQLSRSQCASRACVYKLTFVKGECRRVEQVGSDNAKPKHQMPWERLRPQMIELEFDSDGQVSRHIRRYDQYIVWDFPGLDKIRFSYPDGKPYSGYAISLEHLLGVYRDPGIIHDIRDDLSISKPIAYWDVVRKDGLMTEVLFKDAENAVTLNADGAKGFIFEYDRNGRVCSVRLKGKEHTKNHVAKIKFSYKNEDGRLRSISCLDNKGKPKNSKFGFAEMAIQWNGGNVERYSFFDENGKKASFADAHSIRFSYNEKGYVTEVAQYDEHDKLHVSNIDRFAKAVYQWGKRGELLKLEYKDENGRLCKSRVGYAKQVNEYDADNNLIKESYFEDEMTLVNNQDGYAIALHTYEDGVQVGVEYRNPHNELTLTNMGYASKKKIKMDTEAAGYKQIKEKIGFNNVVNKLLYNEIRLEETCDTQGRLLEVKTLDANNHPVMNDSGYAYSRHEYLGGDINKISYYDKDGNPVKTKEGYFCLMQEPTANNGWRNTYFDTDNKPCTTAEGYFCSITEPILSNNNEFIMRYYDEKGNPCRSIEYGEEGQQTIHSQWFMRRQFIDSNGKAFASHPYGYAVEVIKAFPDDVLVMEHYDKEDLKNTFSPFGTFIQKVKLDKKGRTAEKSYYDFCNYLCLNNRNFAKSVYVYDDDQLTEDVYYYDLENNRCMTSDGYARVKTKRDKNAREVELMYYDVYDNPVKNKEGVAGVQRTYNDDGDVVRKKYVDENQHVIESPAFGYASFEAEYHKSETGDFLETISYYMSDGMQRKSDKGVSKEVNLYDSQKRLLRKENYDHKNNLMNDTEGVAVYHRRYDDEGGYEEYYTDSCGQAVAKRNGVFRVRAEKQQCGFFRESYVDEKGELCQHPKGYYFCRIRSSTCGTVEEMYFYNQENLPCAVGEEQAEGVKHFYDEAGSLLHSLFLDESGRVKDTVKGYAIIDYSYDWRAMKRSLTFRNSDYYACADVTGKEFREQRLLPGGGVEEIELPPDGAEDVSTQQNNLQPNLSSF